MHRTIAKKVFWEFDPIIMQNLSDILPLFCTPTWPSHHMSENQGYMVHLTKSKKISTDDKNSFFERTGYSILGDPGVDSGGAWKTKREKLNDQRGVKNCVESSPFVPPPSTPGPLRITKLKMSKCVLSKSNAKI